MNPKRSTAACGRAALLLVLVCLVAAPGAARAHAYPERADPKVGSTVRAPPNQVRIWFDAAVEPALSSIEVQAPGGAKVNGGRAHVDPFDATLLELDVPPLAPGTYRVVWAVVTRDGHRTSGNYTFTVGS